MEYQSYWLGLRWGVLACRAASKIVQHYTSVTPCSSEMPRHEELMNIFIHHEWEIEKPGQIIQYKT